MANFFTTKDPLDQIIADTLSDHQIIKTEHILTGWTNIVTRQYPRGKTQATSESGFFLWGTNNRQPFAVRGARGIGSERTWLDYNHPEGFPPTGSDGNVMRFIPWNMSPSSGRERSARKHHL